MLTRFGRFCSDLAFSVVFVTRSKIYIKFGADQ